jgi:hypothetical protein
MIRVERTPTYHRLYIGRLYITYNYDSKSTRTCCRMIEMAQSLNNMHLKQMGDYFQTLYESRVK